MADNPRLFPTPMQVRDTNAEWIGQMMDDLFNTSDMPITIVDIVRDALVDWYVNELDEVTRREMLSAWAKYKDENC